MAPKRRRQTENPPYVENSRDQAIIRSLEAMTEMFRSLVPIRIRIKTRIYSRSITLSKTNTDL